MQVKFFKVEVLPDILEPSSFYYVESGGYAEAYLTDNNGIAKAVGNTMFINDVVTRSILGVNDLQIVENIAQRDAMTALATKNLMILVIDATADITVVKGSALYAFSFEPQTTYKVSEYESLDVIVTWAMVHDKPYSTVEEIDDAVTKRHRHANKEVIDKWGVSASGVPTFDGRPVDAVWKTNNW